MSATRRPIIQKLLLAASAAWLALAAALSFPGSFGITRSHPLKDINAGPGFLLSASWPAELPRLRDRAILFPDVPVLMEDGIPLAAPMADRKEIQNGGFGRYRLAGEKVFFSTSDGTATGSKEFLVVAPSFQLREPVLLALWLGALLLAGTALHPLLSRAHLPAGNTQAILGLAASLAILAGLVFQPASTAHNFFSGLALPVVWAVSLAALCAGRSALMGTAALFTGLFPAIATWIHYGAYAASHDSFLVAGTIPWSDAYLHFLQSAGIALDGQTPVAFNGRLLYPAYFSGLLRIAGFHLQAANFLVAASAMASLALVCLVVHDRLHTPGTAVFAALCWLFFRVHGSGLVMTEGLGLACGLLGLACLLQSSQGPSRLVFLGILMLAIGSSARPGALFVLPALVLYAGIRAFHAGGLSDSWPRRLALPGAAILLSLALIGAAFFSNRALLAAFHEGQPSAFGNFSFTLNGLLTGTKWSVSYEATSGDSSAVMKENLRLLKSEPRRLLSGISRAYGELFSKGFLFRFGAERRLAHTALILSAIGIAACWVLPGLRPDALWLTLAAAGIFLSIPCAPPWDAEVRPYAVTVPIQSLLPGAGVAFLIVLWRQTSARLSFFIFGEGLPRPPLPSGGAQPGPRDRTALTSLSCAALLVMVFPIPLALARFAPGRASAEGAWPPDFRPGSSLKVSRFGEPGAVPLPAFRLGLSAFAAERPTEGQEISALQGDFLLGINWSDLKPYAISRPLPHSPPAFQPCGLIKMDPALSHDCP